MRAWFLALLLPLAAPVAAQDTLRIATYNASLSRSGPGVLINRLAEGGDAQIKAVAEIIRTVRPDILLVNEFDHDPVGLAAAMFVEHLGQDGPDTAGLDYPHTYDPPPNTGYLSGQDLDGDGTVAQPNDAFGFGRFPGEFGMLLLSRFPIDQAAARSFARLVWRDLPGARLPVHADGSAFPSPAAQEVMRLSSKSHWDVPIDTPLGRIHLLASHPTPPVFDGPENRNGLRNADEVRFWSLYLDGAAFTDDQGRTAGFAGDVAVVLGDLNADPFDGDGDHRTIGALLAHPLLQDPEPQSAGAVAAAQAQGGANASHRGPHGADTADWNDQRGPGNLRVDYVLPSSTLTVIDAGVFWPAPTDPQAVLLGSGDSRASDHRLVWVDVSR